MLIGKWVRSHVLVCGEYVECGVIGASVQLEVCWKSCAAGCF